MSLGWRYPNEIRTYTNRDDAAFFQCTGAPAESQGMRPLGTWQGASLDRCERSREPLSGRTLRLTAPQGFWEWPTFRSTLLFICLPMEHDSHSLSCVPSKAWASFLRVTNHGPRITEFFSPLPHLRKLQRFCYE